jgi:hypothetical protein
MASASSSGCSARTDLPGELAAFNVLSGASKTTAGSSLFSG